MQLQRPVLAFIVLSGGQQEYNVSFPKVIDDKVFGNEHVQVKVVFYSKIANPGAQTHL